MVTLYQFMISHYCEKVRWGLEYKEIPYKPVNLLPGLHILTTKKLAPKTATPIIVHNDNVVQESSDILSYLDKNFPKKQITPEQQQLCQETVEWERFMDKVGSDLRLLCYNTLLHHRRIVSKLLRYKGAWFGAFVYSFGFPLIKKRMRQVMNINPEEAKKAEESLNEAFVKLNEHLQNRKFMVGESFTRADITTAAILAPICQPPEHPLQWPMAIPEPLKSYVESYSQDRFFDWVLKIYKVYR